MKLYCGSGFSLHDYFTFETDIGVQKGREKVGLSENILVKSHIPKSKSIRGLAFTFFFFISGTDIWVQIGRGKSGHLRPSVSG